MRAALSLPDMNVGVSRANITMNAKASLLDRFDDTVIIPALGQQMSLLGFEPEPARLAAGTYFDAPNIDLDSYDNIIEGTQA